MKRIALLLMVLMLAIPAARAERPAMVGDTRQETIELEGMEEQITTQYFESPQGWYSIWIDPVYLTPLPVEEGDDRDFFLRPDAGEDDAFQLTVMYRDGYTEEQAVADLLVEINDAFGDCEEIDVEPFADRPVFTGYDYRMLHARSGDQSATHFVLGGADGAFVVALLYPTEAAEGFASRVQQMLRSFVAIDPTLPVRE